MATGPTAYKVEDRSILLPYYRRFLVDPLLPLLPATLNPNTITHLGHVMNLGGTLLLIALWPERGWPFAFAMAMLQAYMWCDNADGSHARRTNQCSAFGEFLDHGLDQLNTVYISYLTCLALHVSPLWWVVIALIIPAAGAVTYWEQSETGVFRLGLLNQVESLSVLSLALTASAIWGTGIWTEISFFGVTLQHAILAWSASTILFGMVRAMMRVAAHRGATSIIPILGLVAFGGAIILASRHGAISTITAVALGTGANVYVGMRMLARRLHGERAQLDLLLLTSTVLLGALTSWRAMGHESSPLLGVGIAAVACMLFAIFAIGDTRRSIVHLATSVR
jgi:phosphatidylglycerophosphate synthase